MITNGFFGTNIAEKHISKILQVKLQVVEEQMDTSYDNGNSQAQPMLYLNAVSRPTLVSVSQPDAIEPAAKRIKRS